MFDTCLPHPGTIEKWPKIIDGRPGITSEAFDALRKCTELHQEKQLICALMMNKLAIRQQIEWDGKKFVGYIDIGTGLDDDSMPVAKEALTFVVVGVNDSFRVLLTNWLTVQTSDANWLPPMSDFHRARNHLLVLLAVQNVHAAPHWCSHKLYTE